MFSKKKHPEKETEEFFDAIEAEKEKESGSLKDLDKQPDWIGEEDEEGQLSVDVYEEGNTIVVKSTIAGVEPEDIDVSVDNDMLTIRGERRQHHTAKNRNYFFQECYWGAFSRSIILPVEIEASKIDATIDNGVLTIVLPKKNLKPQKTIRVKER